MSFLTRKLITKLTRKLCTYLIRKLPTTVPDHSQNLIQVQKYSSSTVLKKLLVLGLVLGPVANLKMRILPTSRGRIKKWTTPIDADCPKSLKSTLSHFSKFSHILADFGPSDIFAHSHLLTKTYSTHILYLLLVLVQYCWASPGPQLRG